MSKEANIDRMNEAIALFDDWVPGYGGEGSPYFYKGSTFVPAISLIEQMRYHTDWNWLMGVVTKIEKLESGRFRFTIDPWGVQVVDYKEEEETIVDVSRDDNQPRIEILYHAVYEFITWYNKQQSNEQRNYNAFH